MKTALISELWAGLAPVTERGGDGFAMRLCGASRHTRCYAARSEGDGSPAFIIEMRSPAPRSRFAAHSTRAFSVDYAPVRGLLDTAAALKLTLHDCKLEALFALLCADLLCAVEGCSEAAAVDRQVLSVLESWRSFLSRRSALLSEEEVRGLIGELVTLGRLIVQHGAMMAVQCWQGPIGGLRDFQGHDIYLEAKSFAPSAGASVQISDPLQLECPPPATLLLVCVPVEQTSSGAPLDRYIEAARSLLGRDAGARELFEQRVAAAGFLPSMAEVLTMPFKAYEPRVFAVREGFPRITPSDVPAGVRGVLFSVELAALGSYAVSVDESIGKCAPNGHPFPLT